MPQTKEGAAKAAATNRAKYGDDYFARIGRLGGSTESQFKTFRGTNLKGFATNHAVAVKAGRKGGRISRRGSKKG